MIRVTKIGDLTFEVRFHEAVRQDLEHFSGSSSPEDALASVLEDIVLGCPFDIDLSGDLDDNVPF